MTTLEKLIQHFEQFPGIGSRQAKRFTFHILTLQEANAKELAELILNVRANVRECPSCFRFHTQGNGTSLCSICAGENRDVQKLTIVERDVDIDAIERSGTYDGKYFVFGGTVPLLDSVDTKKLRSGALKACVMGRSKSSLLEVILAFAVNPDGENTGRYIETLLREYIENGKVRITHLGRGLSTGSELEYADPETIKNALKNRF